MIPLNGLGKGCTLQSTQSWENSGLWSVEATLPGATKNLVDTRVWLGCNKQAAGIRVLSQSCSFLTQCLSADCQCPGYGPQQHNI